MTRTKRQTAQVTHTTITTTNTQHISLNGVYNNSPRTALPLRHPRHTTRGAHTRLGLLSHQAVRGEVLEPARAPVTTYVQL